MNDSSKNRTRLRENPDPHEGSNPVPFLIKLLIASVTAWGVFYIATTQHDDDPTLGDHRTLSTLAGKVKGASANGAELYAANCVACHQASGAGLPGAFPPLAGSEWVLGSDKVLANILLQGISGKLTVKQGSYNGAMPAFKDKFDDNEIAAVLSYIRSSFGNTGAKVSADLVAAERAAGKARTAPWNGDEDLGKLK